MATEEEAEKSRGNSSSSRRFSSDCGVLVDDDDFVVSGEGDLTFTNSLNRRANILASSFM